jgi:hypothetical protein
VISTYHDLSDSVNKGYYSSVYDFRNDVDTEIRTHNADRPLRPLQTVTWLHISGVIGSNSCLLLSAPVSLSTKCPIEQGHVLAFSVYLCRLTWAVFSEMESLFAVHLSVLNENIRLAVQEPSSLFAKMPVLY